MGWNTVLTLDKDVTPVPRSTSTTEQEDTYSTQHSIACSSNKTSFEMPHSQSQDPQSYNRSRRRSSTLANLSDTEETHPPKSRRRSSALNTTLLSQLRLTQRQKPLTSRLLTLPAELRNQIYITYFTHPTYSEDCPPRIRPSYTLPPLLKTCRQIYNEAIGLYYSATPAFRCLDEDSTVKWLVNLPERWRGMLKEVRFDTRWIIFSTPFIPVPGAELWLVGELVGKLEKRGFDCERWLFREGEGSGRVEDGEEGGEEEEVTTTTGKLKCSFYRRGGGGQEGAIIWTDKPGLIESVTAAV
ncbi:hypothetical protein CB0940_06991 [Cercospora beticola]|uniref:Uncharacterized protein n=1 Tax=Cercospora beticola TaxID=122368 RepID=A0A2G5H924_CERBT|nr:hypothetical protein CB0940_06991 [Cercospora beticola]PIA88803.1 hypothetical protein CB0940_06991 [Cercospora beticola]